MYMMSNAPNGVIYTGVTNDLARRVTEHRQRKGGYFTTRYKTFRLVYFEVFESPWEAILREKQIKAGSRQKKTELIEVVNPKWQDLSSSLHEYQ
jgi:putative endonuclease